MKKQPLNIKEKKVRYGKNCHNFKNKQMNKFPTLSFPGSAHVGILQTMQSVAKRDGRISEHQQFLYLTNLNWCINSIKENTGCDEFLAQCYNERGMIYAGIHPFCQNVELTRPGQKRQTKLSLLEKFYNDVVLWGKTKNGRFEFSTSAEDMQHLKTQLIQAI